ncbi:MAG TPA: nucleoside permease [Steroidobacteraceae bacterium]|nr:nucleoside permease [Steroidobacteraceae bacterium]
MPMRAPIRVRLSVMMFLQFCVWGSWYVTLSTYLLAIHFNAISVGGIYSTVNWGAILAPVIAGMIADRFFPAQIVMAVLHLVGAAILWWISSITDPTTFFWTLLLYSICFMPTLGLANAVSFHQMSDPARQFPGVRVLGSIGWIVVGLTVGVAAPAVLGHSIENTNLPLRFGAVLSLVMGLYCLTLPHTPPGNAGRRPSLFQALGLETLTYMKDRSFAIFILGSLLICIPLSFYYSFANAFLNETGMQNAAGKMTLGQMSEVLFLFLIPFFFVRLGVKKMLLVGMFAWVARYALFAFGNNGTLVSMLYAGIILHGVCFDFFFVTGQIYVDQTVQRTQRASAQGFIHVVTYGVGQLIGSWAAGAVVDHYAYARDAAARHHWEAIWTVPAVMAMVVALLFMLFFKDPPRMAAVGVH